MLDIGFLDMDPKILVSNGLSDLDYTSSQRDTKMKLGNLNVSMDKTKKGDFTVAFDFSYNNTEDLWPVSGFVWTPVFKLLSEDKKWSFELNIIYNWEGTDWQGEPYWTCQV